MDRFMPEEDVAKMLDLVQEDAVDSLIPNGGTPMRVMGDMILEISKGKCREVESLMDEGPSGEAVRQGNLQINEDEV